MRHELTFSVIDRSPSIRLPLGPPAPPTLSSSSKMMATLAFPNFRIVCKGTLARPVPHCRDVPEKDESATPPQLKTRQGICIASHMFTVRRVFPEPGLPTRIVGLHDAVREAA